jgi:hypothetical protein
MPRLIACHHWQLKVTRMPVDAPEKVTPPVLTWVPTVFPSAKLMAPDTLHVGFADDNAQSNPRSWKASLTPFRIETKIDRFLEDVNMATSFPVVQLIGMMR